MFSVRVHLPNTPGHAMYECIGYKVVPNGTSNTIVMAQASAGEKRTVDKTVVVPDGGMVFVMGADGKTVEVIGRRASAQMRGAR